MIISKILTISFAVLLAVFVGSVCGDVLYSENFETGGSLPNGWNFGTGGANWAADSGSKVFGSYSLRLNLPDANAAADSTTAYGGLISVVPGSFVRLGGYVRTSGVSTTAAKYKASIELIGSHTNEIMAEGFTTTNGYTYLEKTLRIGSLTNSVRVYVRGYGPVGQVWFDYITLETVSMPNNLDAGLYGRWRLDGNFYDYGAKGLNLVSVGTGGAPTINNNGYTGKCYSFNNTVSGAAQALYPGAIDLKNIDGVTITAWINPSVLLPGFTTTSPHTIARLYHSTSVDDILDFRIRDGKLDIYYRRPVANNYTNFSIPLNRWSFVAMTQEGTKLTVYFNSQKQTFTVTSGSNYNRLLLGATATNTARGLNGLLDEVRFYNRALTDDELRDVRGNADINRDRIVNYEDFAILEENSLSVLTDSVIGDINDDGVVDHSDLVIMAASWLENY